MHLIINVKLKPETSSESGRSMSDSQLSSTTIIVLKRLFCWLQDDDPLFASIFFSFPTNRGPNIVVIILLTSVFSMGDSSELIFRLIILQRQLIHIAVYGPEDFRASLQDKLGEQHRLRILAEFRSVFGSSSLAENGIRIPWKMLLPIEEEATFYVKNSKHFVNLVKTSNSISTTSAPVWFSFEHFHRWNNSHELKTTGSHNWASKSLSLQYMLLLWILAVSCI